MHHACVQPRAPDRPDRCDALLACCGFLVDHPSNNVLNVASDVTCLACLSTDWEDIVSNMETLGLLTDIGDLRLAHNFHRALIKGGALAESALQDTRW